MFNELLNFDLAWSVFKEIAQLLGVVLGALLTWFSVILLKSSLDIVRACRERGIHDDWGLLHQPGDPKVPFWSVVDLVMLAIELAMLLCLGYTTVAWAFPGLDIFPGVKMAAVVIVTSIFDWLVILRVSTEVDKIKRIWNDTGFVKRERRFLIRLQGWGWILTRIGGLVFKIGIVAIPALAINLTIGALALGMVKPQVAVVLLIYATDAFVVLVPVGAVALRIWNKIEEERND